MHEDVHTDAVADRKPVGRGGAVCHARRHANGWRAGGGEDDDEEEPAAMAAPPASMAAAARRAPLRYHLLLKCDPHGAVGLSCDLHALRTAGMRSWLAA